MVTKMTQELAAAVGVVVAAYIAAYVAAVVTGRSQQMLAPSLDPLFSAEMTTNGCLLGD